MARILEVLVATLLVLLLGLVVAALLPANRSFIQSVETNRPMTTVFDMLNGFQRFDDWYPMRRLDPAVQYTVSGPESGVGAKLEFRSDKRHVGNGSWEIIESEPGERIVFRVINEAQGTNKTMRFTFDKTGNRGRNVEITQRYRVEYGFNPIGRFAGMYVAGNVGNNIKYGLRSLSNALAAIPRVDYSLHKEEILVAELPAQNVLRVPTVAKRANDEVALAMTNQSQWIDKVIADNNLEKAGPMRIVTVDFGTEAYAFDIVQPVRPKSADAAETTEATETPAEGDAAAETTVAEAPAEPLPMLDLKIEGTGGAENPVKYEQTAPMRVVTSKYVGPAPGLNAVRDQVRAWALVRGMATEGQPFDDYNTEIPAMMNEDAAFQVYWPLKAQ